MFLDHALLYESYALFLFSEGQVLEAGKVYKLLSSFLNYYHRCLFDLCLITRLIQNINSNIQNYNS
jgi:hypothetical protein